MKDERTNEFRQSLLFVIVGLMISLMLIMVFSRVITQISATMTYDTTMAVKKNMLKEYVNNMMIYLDDASADYLEEHPGADEEELESAMLELARERIYSEQHEDGAYMWVQKVLDFNGGDNYAIRLIHPNLSDTEGDLLSTNTLNPSGIKAYETELEGVKENGAIYLTYDFKKLDSDEVTQKVTYSCLYKKFDWIVCMGVNTDDLNHYQQQAKENMRTSQILILAAISLTWIVLLYLMFHAYRKTSFRIFERRHKELSEKLDWDTVTGANSRSYGEKLLEREFQASRQGSNTLIGMLDVDYFKQFNDSFGHDIGDRVLREFVNAVKNCLSDGDAIIRWGGDEFIAVAHNVDRFAASKLGDDIVASVRNITLPGLEGRRRITSSVGLSFFEPDDQSVKDILVRVDKAVYEVKESGRDDYRIL